MRPPRQLNVFIGYDEREPAAYHVLAHSILTRASEAVSVTPLHQPTLRAMGCYWRERGPTESTAFSMTRFLVPYLSCYTGHSVFLDSDILCRVDICRLWTHITEQCFWGREFAPPPDGPDKAVLVVQHDYTPTERTKFLGHIQSAYPRKNWSSVMVFDNARCKALIPEYVNTASGLDLHRFNWIRDEEIGSLPVEWNHLVGEYVPNPNAKMVHWTQGGPWFDGFERAEFADEWFAERDAMLGAGVAA
jgi:hypothetical protein